MRWSIRYQLIIPLLILLIGVAGVSTWTGFASAQRARLQIETQVRDVAHTLTEARYPLTEGVLEQARGLSGAEYLYLSGDGRRTTTLKATHIPLPGPETVALGWQSLHLGAPLQVAERVYLCSSVRVSSPGGVSGTLYILYPEDLLRDALWAAIQPSLLLGGFVGLASVALAAGVAQRLALRIQELERRTRRIAAGDFSPMPLARRNDELRDLAKSVNEMAQQLAQLQQAAQNNERLRLLGQVSAGLAHQLRNGVTGAILAVQLHARQCSGGADPEALNVALRQLALLEANIKRFLDLGRTESHKMEPCQVASLVDEAIALLRPRCKHTHIDLRWQSPTDSPIVIGDSGQLGHLFLNLLGNAADAAGPGGWVECRMQTQIDCSRPDRCVIDVIDSGPGPAPDVAARLFEPFVTGKPGGVGLGLAVARQVAEAHGGCLGWRREADTTVFRVELTIDETHLNS